MTQIELAYRIDLSAEAFQKFVLALGEPNKDMPTLRRYSKKRSPIPKGAFL